MGAHKENDHAEGTAIMRLEDGWHVCHRHFDLATWRLVNRPIAGPFALEAQAEAKAREIMQPCRDMLRCGRPARMPRREPRTLKTTRPKR